MSLEGRDASAGQWSCIGAGWPRAWSHWGAVTSRGLAAGCRHVPRTSARTGGWGWPWSTRSAWPCNARLPSVVVWGWGLHQSWPSCAAGAWILCLRARSGHATWLGRLGYGTWARPCHYEGDKLAQGAQLRTWGQRQMRTSALHSLPLVLRAAVAYGYLLLPHRP